MTPDLDLRRAFDGMMLARAYLRAYLRPDILVAPTPAQIERALEYSGRTMALLESHGQLDAADGMAAARVELECALVAPPSPEEARSTLAGTADARAFLVSMMFGRTTT